MQKSEKLVGRYTFRTVYVVSHTTTAGN